MKKYVVIFTAVIEREPKLRLGTVVKVFGTQKKAEELISEYCNTVNKDWYWDESTDPDTLEKISPDGGLIRLIFGIENLNPDDPLDYDVEIQEFEVEED